MPKQKTTIKKTKERKDYYLGVRLTESHREKLAKLQESNGDESLSQTARKIISERLNQVQ